MVNQLYMVRTRQKTRAGLHRSTFRPEQRIGCGAVGARPVAVRADPGNLCFQQFDAYCKFVLRIAVKAFAGQSVGGIAARAGAIIIVHRVAESYLLCLLSTKHRVRGRGA